MTDQERVHTLVENGLDRPAIAAIFGVSLSDIHAAEKDGTPLPLSGSAASAETLAQVFKAEGASNTPVGEELISYRLDGTPNEQIVTVLDTFAAADSLFCTVPVPDREIIVGVAATVLHLVSGDVFVVAGQTDFTPLSDPLTPVHVSGGASTHLTITDDHIVVVDPSVLIAQIKFQVENVPA